MRLGHRNTTGEARHSNSDASEKDDEDEGGEDDENDEEDGKDEDEDDDCCSKGTTLNNLCKSPTFLLPMLDFGFGNVTLLNSTQLIGLGES